MRFKFKDVIKKLKTVNSAIIRCPVCGKLEVIILEKFRIENEQVTTSNFDEDLKYKILVFSCCITKIFRIFSFHIY